MLLIAPRPNGRFLCNPLCFHCKRYLERHGFLFGRRLILGGADMLLIAGGYILHSGIIAFGSRPTSSFLAGDPILSAQKSE